MPNFVVPVSFSVDAENADEATAIVEKLLADAGVDKVHFTPYQGHRTDVEGVEVSPALSEFLNQVIEDNDNDTSGWDTDLDWAFAVCEDNDEVSEDVKDELSKLITNVGGEVKVATLLGD